MSSRNVARETPADDTPELTLPEVIGELIRLQDETRALVDLLDFEIGKKWMSVDLKLQLEKIEILLRLQFADGSPRT